MREEIAARRLRYVRPDHGDAERLAHSQPFHDGLGSAIEVLCVALDELDRRHDFAVARGLEKPHVLGVGVDDVHRCRGRRGVCPVGHAAATR